MSTGTMRSRIAAYGPPVIAAALGIASAVAGLTQLIPPDRAGVIDVAAVISATWAIARRYGAPRLRPGKSAVPDETIRAIVSAVAEGYAAAGHERREQDERTPPLRSLG